MSEALSKIFDVENVPAYQAPQEVVVSVPEEHEDKDASRDIELAQNNLKNLMKIASDALQEAMNVAIQSESPRAYEVVTGMINASADLSTKLIDTHSSKQKMKLAATGKNPVPQSGGNVTNNNLNFVGSTAELAKLLKGQNGSI